MHKTAMITSRDLSLHEDQVQVLKCTYIGKLIYSDYIIVSNSIYVDFRFNGLIKLMGVAYIIFAGFLHTTTRAYDYYIATCTPSTYDHLNAFHLFTRYGSLRRLRLNPD